MENINLVIFTDLDGSLLDHETYSFEAARQALEEVERGGIPLVLCTSKARAEVECYRRALSNHHPFIVENGGATFIPQGYFAFPYPYQGEIAGYHVIAAGTPYSQLVVALRMVREDSGASIVGFSDLSAVEVAQLTSLPLEKARLAKEREYDEPFFVNGSEEEAERVKALLRKRGFLCTQGGRFAHLTGPNDKGNAISVLTELFRQTSGKVRTVGIGDSQNDLPMLRAVDVAILVERPDGTHDPAIRVPNLVRAHGIGPRGWQEAVLDLLSKNDR